jgi:plastocyanin
MKTALRLLLFGFTLGFAVTSIPERSTFRGVSAQSDSKVLVTNYKFEPKKLTVTEGSTVTWENKEGLHTVKSDTDAFLSKNLKPGESFQYQFTKPGTYPYHCSFHGSKGGGDMAGTIVVVKKK